MVRYVADSDSVIRSSKFVRFDLLGNDMKFQLNWISVSTQSKIPIVLYPLLNPRISLFRLNSYHHSIKLKFLRGLPTNQFIQFQQINSYKISGLSTESDSLAYLINGEQKCPRTRECILYISSNPFFNRNILQSTITFVGFLYFMTLCNCLSFSFSGSLVGLLSTPLT